MTTHPDCSEARTAAAMGHTLTYRLIHRDADDWGQWAFGIEIEIYWHDRGETHYCDSPQPLPDWPSAFDFVATHCSDLPADTRVIVRQTIRYHDAACPVCRTTKRLLGVSHGLVPKDRYCRKIETP